MSDDYCPWCGGPCLFQGLEERTAQLLAQFAEEWQKKLEE